MKEYISLHKFVKMGGKPEKGMKVYINPPFKNAKDLVRNARGYDKMCKEYTLNEIVPEKGVKVDEVKRHLGTGCVYTLQKFKLK